jgi:hypothetical protein
LVEQRLLVSHFVKGHGLEEGSIQRRVRRQDAREKLLRGLGNILAVLNDAVGVFAPPPWSSPVSSSA